jgi:hypothetical protein
MRKSTLQTRSIALDLWEKGCSTSPKLVLFDGIIVIGWVLGVSAGDLLVRDDMAINVIIARTVE